MDGRIVSIGLAVTFGLIYTRAFENDFFKDIILISIPAIIGLFVAKRVPNEWQQYRFKVNLKKEIIDLFGNSGNRGFTAQDTATRQLGYHYSDAELPMNLITGETTLHVTEFPSEKDKQPLVALKKEYDEFNKEMMEIRHNGTILISKMRLYFDNENMVKDYRTIALQSGKSSQLVRQAFQSTDLHDFQKYINTFHDESVILRILLDKFENNLVKQKIRKISV